MVVTPSRRETSQIARKWWVIGSGLALLVFIVAFIIWRWSTTPTKRTRGFVEAIERRDAEAVYALILPQQRQAMNLTPEKVRAVLEQTIWRFGPVKAILVEEVLNFEGGQDKALWVVTWGDAATGGRLPVSEPKGLERLTKPPAGCGRYVAQASCLHSFVRRS